MMKELIGKGVFYVLSCGAAIDLSLCHSLVLQQFYAAIMPLIVFVLWLTSLASPTIESPGGDNKMMRGDDALHSAVTHRNNYPYLYPIFVYGVLLWT